MHSTATHGVQGVLGGADQGALAGGAESLSLAEQDDLRGKGW